jgi:murein DD-endopeptidase MepM/ murein hydrolase activator NlpD
MVLVLLAGVVVWKALSQDAPAIELRGQVRGIGQSTPVTFGVSDARHHLKSVTVRLHQGESGFTAHEATLPTPAWWKFWSKAGEKKAEFSLRLGRKQFPDLKEGRATLHITATNDSWGRFFRGGRSDLTLDLPVRFVPPSVEVLTSQHYINQGGCDLVLFKVSPGTVESGVSVGDRFFPSWPVTESLPETRFCVFAYLYDVDPKTPSRILARDDAGNETLANFSYKVFPKVFKKDTLTLSDEFMARVVPAIMSQTPDLEDQGSLLQNFLEVNGRLRARNARELQAFAQKTSPRRLWSKPFIQLTNSKVEAAFADDRTYVYNGEKVDRQTHLGFDLAVVEHNPVVAANDGVVLHAGYFGIYGNTVIVDHGCGLQTLYAHLSSVEVKAGTPVERGQVIGRSGQTGLAGGDHLHFTTLLNGFPVNPVEWWDAHWIHDRIEAKLAPYR